MTRSQQLAQEDTSAAGHVPPDERNKAYADVHGRLPPDLERKEYRMADLEREIGLLPDERKESVLMAMRHNPLLFTSSAHSVLFANLSAWGEEEGEFDAKEGAARMARYWEQRERIFGHAAFDEDCFRKPTRMEYLKFFERSLALSEDPDADETMRSIAKEYVKNVKEAKVEAFDEFLEGIPREERTALLDAQTNCPDLVTFDHKLQFLKAEDWNENNAVRRMVKYWEMKYELFPETSRRHKKITLGDLDEYEVELHCGLLRLMPNKDEHGRSVLVVTWNRMRDGLNPDGVAAISWYLIESAMELTSCGENGVIILTNYINTCLESFRGALLLRHCGRKIIFESLPVQVKAVHVFFESNCPWWKRVFIEAFAIASPLQIRTKVYFGPGNDTSEQLQQEYGVTAQCIPTDLGGGVSTEAWEGWIAVRKAGGL
mmetsp:Transcript_3073/g.8016  ORF Transcript_3073/g.8016 Transcript_3073/m.8016 type:complete len:431 (+) Transcript_3073:428-1720(+)